MSHIEVKSDVPRLYTEHFEERISRKKYTKKAKIFSQLTYCFSITPFKILKYYTNKDTRHLSTLCAKPAKFVNVRAGGKSSNHCALTFDTIKVLLSL
jgi:hypothetical protein